MIWKQCPADPPSGIAAVANRRFGWKTLALRFVQKRKANTLFHIPGGQSSPHLHRAFCSNQSIAKQKWRGLCRIQQLKMKSGNRKDQINIQTLHKHGIVKVRWVCFPCKNEDSHKWVEMGTMLWDVGETTVNQSTRTISWDFALGNCMSRMEAMS